jgi:hypothetical protein
MADFRVPSGPKSPAAECPSGRSIAGGRIESMY